MLKLQDIISFAAVLILSIIVLILHWRFYRHTFKFYGLFIAFVDIVAAILLITRIAF